MQHDFPISQIFIDQTVISAPMTRRITAYYAHIQPTVVKYDDQFHHFLENMSIHEGKKTLWVTRFKGKFLKPCPGTDESYRCCNYLVINESTNCPIDCTYCILQGYISAPAITIYTNTEDIATEIKELSQKNPQRILRIGTGELTDSLALDPVTRLAGDLITQVNQLPNVILELKSKTNFIDHLLDLPAQKIVLSWSVNPQKIIDSDEFKATTLQERLAAAKLAGEKGFMLGLHFDPIIYLPEWQKFYSELITEIGKYVNPDRIAWISMGSLRYPTQLKEIVRGRFPKSRIFSGEQISGMDGKTRYLRQIRQQMYSEIFQQLKTELGDVFIYFCMESELIWQKIMQKEPADNLTVDWYFAESLHQKFPELHLPAPLPETYREEINW